MKAKEKMIKIEENLFLSSQKVISGGKINNSWEINYRNNNYGNKKQS